MASPTKQTKSSKRTTEEEEEISFDDMERSPLKASLVDGSFDDNTAPISSFGEHSPFRMDGSPRFARRKLQYSPNSNTSWWSLRGIFEFVGFCILLIATLRNGKPNDVGGVNNINNNGSKSSPPAVSTTKENHVVDDDDYHRLVASYRQRAGAISVELILKEPEIRELNLHHIDIGDFVDLVDEAIDTIGVRGAYEDVFNIYALTTALNDAFDDAGLAPNLHTIIQSGDQGPGADIKGRLPGGIPPMKIPFWWPHWVGAITADKLVQDGSLRLSRDSDEHVDAVGFFQEVKRLTTDRKYPDINPYHSVHGFWWQYLALTRPDLDDYPTDLYESFCEPWLEDLDFNDLVQNSMWRECRHGVGHAVFYAMILREDWFTGELNVRHQFLDKTVELNDNNFCEAERICDIPTDEEVSNKCHGGLHHSISIFDPDPNKAATATRRRKEVCNLD